MRELTFPGFLKQYVAALSAQKTNAVYPLVRETASSNARLRTPLFLYALFHGKMQTLLAASRKTNLFDQYRSMDKTYTRDFVEGAFRNDLASLPDEFQKVWNSYCSVLGERERAARVKGLIRERVLERQREKDVSTYRVCQDLHLSGSNINSWLNNGDGGKVSLQTARRVLQWLQNAPSPQK